jgi:hypothetical protein
MEARGRPRGDAAHGPGRRDSGALAQRARGDAGSGGGVRRRRACGLRSLSPRDAAYSGRYAGGPESRDGVYHQGTVWAWLAGPFIAAYLRVNGDGPESRARARSGWRVSRSTSRTRDSARCRRFSTATRRTSRADASLRRGVWRRCCRRRSRRLSYGCRSG